MARLAIGRDGVRERAVRRPVQDARGAHHGVKRLDATQDRVGGDIEGQRGLEPKDDVRQPRAKVAAEVLERADAVLVDDALGGRELLRRHTRGRRSEDPAQAMWAEVVVLVDRVVWDAVGVPPLGGQARVAHAAGAQGGADRLLVLLARRGGQAPVAIRHLDHLGLRNGSGGQARTARRRCVVAVVWRGTRRSVSFEAASRGMPSSTPVAVLGRRYYGSRVSGRRGENAASGNALDETTQSHTQTRTRATDSATPTFRTRASRPRRRCCAGRQRGRT